MNLGNTCCINSFIQCLNTIAPIIEYIKKDLSVPDSTITHELQDVINALQDTNPGVLSPQRFVRAIHMKFAAWVSPGQQLDIHELWSLIMDTIDEENKATSKAAIKQKELNISNIDKNTSLGQFYVLAETNWFDKVRLSAWSDITKWLFVSQVQCKNPACQKIYHNFESFSELSIPIDAASSAVSIQSCVDEYFKPEVLEGWRCDDCKECGNAEKVMRIWRAPNVAAVALKRTKVTEAGALIKIMTPVNIDESLSLTKWSIQPAAERGAAAILIELSQGNITVRHAETGEVLAQAKGVASGSWNKIWATLADIGVTPN